MVATIACRNFVGNWDVAKVTDGALVCTLYGVGWGSNCNSCSKWRLLVWEDGGFEYNDGEHGYTSPSTVAGKYYGGHQPCVVTDNHQLCGTWTMKRKAYSIEIFLYFQS